MAPDADWPPITDERLLSIWRAPDEDLFELVGAFLQRMGERIGTAVTEPTRELAFAYPFGHADRPTYVNGTDIHHPDPAEAAELRSGRFPLLAVGANGSPMRLATKLLALDDRTALLTPAELEGADICALPFPAGYGSFAAGLATSPGTVVDVILLDLTHEQLEWLAITEFGYRLARLSGTQLRAADGRVIDAPLAFVQRGGLYDIGGDTPAPLAAIPARDRRWPAWDQTDLFANCAARLGIPGADPEVLVTQILADPGGWMAAHAPRFIGEASRTHDPPHEVHPAATGD